MDRSKPIFICDFFNCERIFTTKYSLSRHMQTHRKKKDFKCKECDKTFSIKQNLIEHEFVHTGQLPYLCNFEGCTERFRQRGKLALHRQTHKNYNKKAYRSHNLINEGETKTTRECPLNDLVNLGNSVPTNTQNRMMTSSLPANTNFYVMTNPCGKISHFSCNQRMVQIPRHVPIGSGVFIPRQVTPINLGDRRVFPSTGNNSSLPRLSMMMLQPNNFRFPFN